MEIGVANTSSVTSKHADRMLTYGQRSIGNKGCRTQLEDLRWYVDFEMGLHGAPYGYCAPWWSETIAEAARTVQASSIAPADERIVAAMLGQFYPDVQEVRFGLRGSDATEIALKLSRAYTGREPILSQGYHGVASGFAKSPGNPSRPGLAEIDMSRGTLAAERENYHDLEWLGEYGDLSQYAAVFIETPPNDGGKERATRWLDTLFDEARKCGTITVLDEIVTGFRYGRQGSAGRYDLIGKVDLYCFGKALANGYDCAAIAGRKDLLDELGNGVHGSSTFYANPISLRVAKATLRRYLEHPPWEYLRYIGTHLKQCWNELQYPWPLVGHPSRPIVDPNANMSGFEDLRAHLFRRGIIFVDHPLYSCVPLGKVEINELIAAAKDYIWNG